MNEEKEFGEPETYEELFEECFRDFEESGYDLALILKIEEKIVTHMQTLARETGKPQKLNYPIRLALEYIVRRVPKDDSILQELLLERIRDLWKQRHLKMEKDNNRELLKQFEWVLNKSLSRAINETFYELQGKQSIQIEAQEKENIESFHDADNTAYKLCIIRERILHWTGNLTQLAKAITHIEAKLGLNSLTAYSVSNFVKNSGVVNLSNRSFDSLKSALQQVKRAARDKEVIANEDFTSDSAKALLSVLKLT